MKHAGKLPIRVLSNLQRLDGVETEGYRVTCTYVGGRASIWSGIQLFFQSFRYDAVIFSSETRRLLIFCFLKTLFPFSQCVVLGVDYILQEPIGLRRRLLARIKGRLLSKVDRFILHFVETSVYQRYYGIPQERCAFVPFKVNHYEVIANAQRPSSNGEYVFTAGRSFRDFRTFVHAMRHTGYPGLLLYEDPEIMIQGGTKVDLESLPENLKAIKNPGEQSWVDYIVQAKVVVIPLLPTSGYAPGLSLYLMAMAMKKCVIITEGLSTRGMLTNQAIIVPPEDPMALAEAIDRVWNDAELRERVAAAGQHYASGLGGEARLLGDILNICGRLVEGKEAEVERIVATRA